MVFFFFVSDLPRIESVEFLLHCVTPALVAKKLLRLCRSSYNRSYERITQVQLQNGNPFPCQQLDISNKSCGATSTQFYIQFMKFCSVMYFYIQFMKFCSVIYFYIQFMKFCSVIYFYIQFMKFCSVIYFYIQFMKFCSVIYFYIQFMKFCSVIYFYIQFMKFCSVIYFYIQFMKFCSVIWQSCLSDVPHRRIWTCQMQLTWHWEV